MLSQANPPTPTVVLTAYFGATSHRFTRRTAALTADGKQTISGADIIFHAIKNDEKQYAIAFDGVGASTKSIKGKIRGIFGKGASNGFLAGGAFGVGIEGQCRQVEKIVDDLVRAGKKVIVNCYGESRGGVAALLTAKNLSKYNKETVITNVAVIDPVPGNSFIGRFLDFFNLSLTNQTLDLSMCKNLKNALGIYNTGNKLFHTAIVPTYPESCRVSHRIVHGGHLHDSYWKKLTPKFSTLAVFLRQNGTQLEKLDFVPGLPLPKDYPTHSYVPLHSSQDKEIAILNPLDIPTDDENFLRDNKSFFETKILPFILIGLKWLMLGAAIATILYFTGGLAALPIIGKILGGMGAISILASLPVTSVIGRVFSPIFNFIARGISRVGFYLFNQDDPGIRNPALENTSYGKQKSFLEKIQPYVQFAFRALIFGVTVAAILYFTGGLGAIPLLGGLAKGLAIVSTGSVIGGIAGVIYAPLKRIFCGSRETEPRLTSAVTIAHTPLNPILDNKNDTPNSSTRTYTGLKINPEQIAASRREETFDLNSEDGFTDIPLNDSNDSPEILSDASFIVEETSSERSPSFRNINFSDSSELP